MKVLADPDRLLGKGFAMIRRRFAVPVLSRPKSSPRPNGCDRARRRSMRIDPHSLAGAAFQIAVRRATGGADYMPYRSGHTPWHAALEETLCPRHRADAPARGSQCARRGVGAGERPGGSGNLTVRTPRAGKECRRLPQRRNLSPPCSALPRRCCCRAARVKCSTPPSPSETRRVRNCNCAMCR